MRYDHKNERMLADKTKEDILEIINNNDYEGALSWFVDDISRFVPSKISIPILTDFVLNHNDAVIRESALYGLSGHDEDHEVRETIYKVFKTVSYKGIREIAWELIEEYHSQVCHLIETCICKHGDV